MLINQDLYPAHQVDAVLSDGDNDRQNELAGDDAGGQGAPSTESITPNPFGSGMTEQIRSFAADQTTTATPSGSSQQKKKRVVLASKPKQPAPSDQVIIKLPPYRGPQSPLDLVVVEFVLGRLFEAFRHTFQAAGTGTSAGADTQLTKKSWVPSMRKVLTPKYVMILICTLLLLNSICIMMMMRLSIGNLRQLNHRRKLSSW
jgi:hypothetical protein